MNYSKLFLVLLAGSASLVIAAATSSPRVLVPILHHAILTNDLRAFKIIYPQVARLRGDDDWQRTILQRAVDHHRLEIADYLLEQDFCADCLFFELIPPFPRSGSLANFKPDIGQLRVLASRHPHKIEQILPRVGWFRRIEDPAIILFLIDFIEYCRTTSAEFAENHYYHPSNMLAMVLVNDNIGDVDMAAIIDRLVHLGARIAVGPWKDFRQKHAEHVQSLSALNAALIIEEDVKEPECD
jgi:hypothetical protein